MTPKIQKITIPTIIDITPTSTRRVTPPHNIPADEECLFVIYHTPTVRQARTQFWLSLKMLIAALRRAAAKYLQRINRAHNAVCAFYLDLPEEQPQHKPEENRSSHNGHA